LNCCYESECGLLGFPVLNCGSADKNKFFGTIFGCVDHPSAEACLQQLRLLVSLAKKAIAAAPNGHQRQVFADHLIGSFYQIFGYMSTRNVKSTLLRDLHDEDFIPVIVNKEIEWHRPSTVFFKKDQKDESDIDLITASLFVVIPFNSFLASAGVKQEASTKDIFEVKLMTIYYIIILFSNTRALTQLFPNSFSLTFQMMISRPQVVFTAVKGEKNYRALLRRVAADRPFRYVTSEIRESAWLLAYAVSQGDDSEEGTRCELAKARDIFIIDNTYFSRMFKNVKRAPFETDLEDFYTVLGSNYISKEVQKAFDVVGSKYQSLCSILPSQHGTDNISLFLVKLLLHVRDYSTTEGNSDRYTT
jgi:hypothetical protein